MSSLSTQSDPNGADVSSGGAISTPGRSEGDHSRPQPQGDQNLLVLPGVSPQLVGADAQLVSLRMDAGCGGLGVPGAVDHAVSEGLKEALYVATAKGDKLTDHWRGGDENSLTPEYQQLLVFCQYPASITEIQRGFSDIDEAGSELRRDTNRLFRVIRIHLQLFLDELIALGYLEVVRSC